jgi:hypothetical protein
VLIPGISLVGGSAVLAQTAATTSTSVATSAASYIGSKITMDSYKLDQLREADAIALVLLGVLGWNKNDIADALVADTRVMSDDSWSNDLRASADDVFKLASMQNNIIALDVSSTSNDETVLKIGLEKPLVNLPLGFTTDTPPRVVLDFLNTSNGLGKTAQDFQERDLNSAQIIQVAKRTRISINLKRALAYNTRIEGSNLLVILAGKATNTTGAGDAPRITETDPAARQR